MLATTEKQIPRQSNDGCDDAVYQQQLQRGKLVQVQNLLLSSHVLDTITELLLPFGPQYSQSRHDALDIIHVLLQGDGNKGLLAENDGLLSAVVVFALNSTQVDQKSRAKQVILELVPEI
jgi:hypothetical protein